MEKIEELNRSVQEVLIVLLCLFWAESGDGGVVGATPAPISVGRYVYIEEESSFMQACTAFLREGRALRAARGLQNFSPNCQRAARHQRLEEQWPLLGLTQTFKRRRLSLHPRPFADNPCQPLAGLISSAKQDIQTILLFGLFRVVSNSISWPSLRVQCASFWM